MVDQRKDHSDSKPKPQKGTAYLYDLTSKRLQPDYTCQKQEKEENLPALKLTAIQRLEDDVKRAKKDFIQQQETTQITQGSTGQQ